MVWVIGSRILTPKEWVEYLPEGGDTRLVGSAGSGYHSRVGRRCPALYRTSGAPTTPRELVGEVLAHHGIIMARRVRPRPAADTEDADMEEQAQDVSPSIPLPRSLADLPDEELDRYVLTRLVIAGVDLSVLPEDDPEAPADRVRILRSARAFLRATVSPISQFELDPGTALPALYPPLHPFSGNTLPGDR